MDALFHFIFELLKIAILSLAYAAVLFLIMKLFRFLTKSEVVFSRHKFFQTYLVLYGILLIFSFTYYGDHGLGDEYRIPLGHGEAMMAIDQNPYINIASKGTGEMVDTKAYLVKDDYLCAATDTGYLVYNLSTKENVKFVSKQVYNTYAVNHDLPDEDLFIDFFEQYDNYWSGWRLWMLP